MDWGAIAYNGPDGVQQEYKLRLGSMTFGRGPENDVVLEDEAISQFHLRLVCTSEGCWVLDLNSTTGTFLNQMRIQPTVRQFLRTNDILRLGSWTLRYNAHGTAVLPPEVAAKLAPASSPRRIRRLQRNIGPPRVRRYLPRQFGASTYMEYLPPAYQDDDFISRFLLIFESIFDPIERMVDQIHLYFDPWMTPEPLLPWLASWVDLVLNEKWPVERQRALIAATAELYRWRGTRRGLSEYIRIYTGIEPLIDEASGESDGTSGSKLPPHVFRVTLEVPDPDLIERDLVEAIINAEKPAHAAYVLEIRRATTAVT